MPYACPINGKGAALNITNLQKENNNNSSISLSTPPPATPPPPPSHHSSTTKQTSLNTPPIQTQHQKPASPQSSSIKHNAFFIVSDDDEDTQLENDDSSQEVQRLKPAKSTASLVSSSSSPTQHLLAQRSPNLPTSTSTSPNKSSIIRSNSRKTQMNAGGISKLSLNLSEILKFPKESTHAYSYAHLSPNSLAVRLSILKRSLEILVDRPDLLQEDSDIPVAQDLNLDIESFVNQIHNEEDEENFKIRSNASSAALAALFTSANNNNNNTPPSTRRPTSSSSSSTTTHLGLKALINILQEDKSLNSTGESHKELAMNLHDLSLSNVADESISAKSMSRSDSDSQLKVKLLHALATPFYEPIVSTPIISLQKGASTLALSSLNQQQQQTSGGDGRVFHSMSQKNTSPQAVFTCELSDPWNLKAANDLACLIFGVSRNSLKRLTLLDLISPDSRDFVLNRLVKNSIEKNQDIIFSGQVIAIAKPGNKLTWASMWAKRKGNLIICMFDQVPCDSIDLLACLDSLKIESFKKISGNSFFTSSFLSNLDTLDQLINNIKDFTTLDNNEYYGDFNNLPSVLLQTQTLNIQRYFTLKKNGYNIPCALYSKVIDENLNKVKLKIHSLPYIAGVFIISNNPTNYNILSFNESIAKNLFGFHESQLKNQPITKIIPGFKKILSLTLKSFKNLKIIPGLVLPEHFFRQMNSILEKAEKNDNSKPNDTSESNFLNSIGIDGQHVDGSTIKIDVQLRCSNTDTLILWVTHSRAVYQNELDNEILSRPPMKKTRSVRSVKIVDNKEEIVEEEVEIEDAGDEKDGDDAENEEMPSQLSILNENEIRSVSRSSSLRSSNVTSSSDLSTLSSIKNDQFSNDEQNSASSELNEAELENFKVLSKNMNETRLLKIENETIEKNKSSSKYYPKKIGAKRREKSIKEFKVLKNMGQGAYGKVVLAEYRKDPNYRIVIKLIIKERILVDTWVRDRKLGTIPSEIQIMSTLNNNPHPNIMRLIDFFEDDDYYYIETPQHGFPTPGIDLFDLIELKKSMTEVECKSIIKQCISAINHLHNNGIVHRDLKDENLIIDNNGVIKLIDFGSAAYVKTGPFDVFVGTLDYAAPEVLNGLPYEGKPQDVWSLGILLYTLIYKENPFYNVDEIMEGELRIPFVTSQGCIELIKKILQRDIKKRPIMADIVKDNWLNEV